MARTVCDVLSIAAVLVIIAHIGCSGNQSFLLYRMPYETNTDVSVIEDHETHSPPDQLDLQGVNGSAPYRVVAAQTGVIRFIMDSNSVDCCGGTCSDNYVWIQHVGEEWTKYAHLEPGSVTNDAGLSVGDVVIAGTFLGYESDIGRECGTGLHFEVGVPDNPANPLSSTAVGTINGENRVPRICGVQGSVLTQGDVENADACSALVDCIQSTESPSTEGNCEAGIDGQVCVQELHPFGATSTYQQGVDFESTTVKIDFEWCPDADCDALLNIGRAIQVIFLLENGDDVVFTANCNNRRVVETVKNVDEIIIRPAEPFTPENLACSGELAEDAFAKWEICEVPILLTGF